MLRASMMYVSLCAKPLVQRHVFQLYTGPQLWRCLAPLSASGVNMVIKWLSIKHSAT